MPSGGCQCLRGSSVPSNEKKDVSFSCGSVRGGLCGAVNCGSHPVSSIWLQRQTKIRHTFGDIGIIINWKKRKTNKMKKK
jgi:hypothetical protein